MAKIHAATEAKAMAAERLLMQESIMVDMGAVTWARRGEI